MSEKRVFWATVAIGAPVAIAIGVTAGVLYPIHAPNLPLAPVSVPVSVVPTPELVPSVEPPVTVTVSPPAPPPVTVVETPSPVTVTEVPKPRKRAVEVPPPIVFTPGVPCVSTPGVC